MDLKEEELHLLKTQTLLQGLTEAELIKIYSLLKKKTFEVNEVILEEGEFTTDLYLIIQGEVSILKWDAEHRYQLPLSTLASGQLFGEMSFMDTSPRSSTIKTTRDTTVWQLSRGDLNNILPEMADVREKIFTNIAIINIMRLREANKNQVKNLRSEVASLQRRTETGQFISVLLLLLGLLIMGSLALRQYFSLANLELVAWLLAFPFVLQLVRSYHYYFSEFGMTVKNWKQSLLESIFVGLVGIGCLSIGYWGWQQLNLVAVQEPMPSFPSLWLWGGLFVAYSFVKEFIARGVLQTSADQLFKSSNTSVWFTALFIALLQIPFFYTFALFELIAGVILGYLYVRHRTLLGVFIIHLVWGLYIKYLGYNYNL